MNDNIPGLDLEAHRIGTWLLTEAAFMPSMDDALTGFCECMRRAGVPVERVTTVVQLVNAASQAVGREWRLGKPITERLYPFGVKSERSYERSPFAVAHRTGQWVELRVPETPDSAFGVISELKAESYTHYICIPLTFSSGRKRNGITFATRDTKGFTAANVALIRAIVPALRAVMEIRAGDRIMSEILQTYVGGDPHDRILAGDIHRGKVTRIKSAIFFSDLRGFTTLSMALPEEDVADLLNRYFDCIVPEIESRGGEVLKFIGDGILAIFHDKDMNPAMVCQQALDSAKAGLARIDKANAYGSLAAQLVAGIALHYGDAAYGNVGSGQRLDFTVIGQDINITNRIARLNGQLKRTILMSESFASRVACKLDDLGRFTLRGVPDQQALFSPSAMDCTAGAS